MTNYVFQQLGPSPIQDPFQNRLYRPATWGAGLVTGAIQGLKMVQDPITKDGWLYAGGVNGGVWGREYKAEGDAWGQWKWLSGGADYGGVQSISKIATTDDNNWLIAAAGNRSNYNHLSGKIEYPLQIAQRKSDGNLSWLPSELNAAAQAAIKGMPIYDLAITKDCVIIGTDNGAYVGLIASDGTLSTIGQASSIPKDERVASICVGASGRIYAAVIDSGLYTITTSDLQENPAASWELIPETQDFVKDKIALRVDSSVDQTSGWEILYLGVANRDGASGAISNIYASPWTGISSGLRWTSTDVRRQIGNSQADPNFSFAADPTDPNKVFAGGNYFSPTYGRDSFSGGLVGIQFPGFNARSIRGGTPIAAKVEKVYGTYLTPDNAAGTGPHADSRTISYYSTKGGEYRIIESDDGGIYHKDIDLRSPWIELNDGLDTTETFYADWSNIGNLAITAMQDNATAVLSYKTKPTWLNINGGDGAVARFDDGITGSNGISRSYHSAQMYGQGSGLWSQAYDSSGLILSQEYLNLNIVDRFRNIQSFKDYEQALLNQEILRKDNWSWKNTEYPFYSPVETSAYRAGDLLISGIRNIYEQITPHWENTTPGEAYLLPLLEDDKLGNWRYFIDLATGSSQGLNFTTDKPRSWDTLYVSSIEYDANEEVWTPRLYGRKSGTTSDDWFKDKSIYQLKDLSAYLPEETRGKAITGITYNPDQPDQVWATVGSAESKANDPGVNAPLQKSKTENSYIIHSNDGGMSWQVLDESADNYLDIVYAPATNTGKPSELFVSGYGAIWSTQLDHNNRAGQLIKANLQHGIQTTAIPKLWIPELKYDPVDDVVIASTLGQGVWMVSRSDSGITPLADIEPGLRITSTTMPQDEGGYSTRKGRPIENVLAVTLTRDAANANQTVTAQIKLPDGWQNYLFFEDFYRQDPRSPIKDNHINLSFPMGVDTLYIDIQPRLYFPIDSKYGQADLFTKEEIALLTIPDAKLDLLLVNAQGASIIKPSAYAYLYATLDTLYLNQLETGVFDGSNPDRGQLAQTLEILMPRASLNAGDRLFWYAVDKVDGSLLITSNGEEKLIAPNDPRYSQYVKERYTLLATASQPVDSRAFSPEKAYLAFDNPSIVLESEGINIGELTTSSGSGLPEHRGDFAFAIQPASGPLRLSPLGFSVDPAMDNAAWFGAAGSSGTPQVVLAPGNGELFIADDSIFAQQGLNAGFDRIAMDLSVARFTDSISGYGIYRVDDPTGAFHVIDNQRTNLQPGSLDYAKEAIKRSLSGGLDGITGLTIPAYAQSIKHELELATGNAYALYITPGKVVGSANQLNNLSEILFSVKNANADQKLKQISMATGYFAFEDGLKDGRDFNDMLFALTPRLLPVA
ncbi:DUF4114 domain-containing protein [Vulcanococcus sp.]|jgi:hypothetical protein|uniref:DUF4114 domain-containing protein n=1 Tax=Vulcanococcus sp. TaxID=2856995 RepID=UPI0037D9FA01